MKDDIIKKMKDDRLKVDSLIDNLQLIEAGRIVSTMLSNAGIYGLNEKLEKEIQTFRYLLHYMTENMPDPNRDTILSSISDKLETWADLALRAVNRKDNSNYYYSVLRLSEYRNEHLEDIFREYGEIISELNLAKAAGNEFQELSIRKEKICEQLFNAIFTSLGDETTIRNLGKFIVSGYAEEEIIAVSISAITLGLLHFYEQSKIDVLLEIVERDFSESASSKALIGILLALIFYPNRIRRNESLLSRISGWIAKGENSSRLKKAIILFISARDTERITSKLNNEVIPEIMKLRPEIIERLKGITHSEINESALEEFQNNPEWEELLSSSGLSSKLEELNKFQSEGADVMMLTFSKLKNFPFFNTATNWFLPFESDHSALKVPAEAISFLDTLSQSGAIICDSDKYSFALAVSTMPEMQRKMLFSQFKLQQEQIQEERSTSLSGLLTDEFEVQLQKSIRDLYRFFKLFRKRDGIKDPFTTTIRFYEFPVIGEILRENNFMNVVAEFYFSRGYYADALPLLNIIVSNTDPDPTIYEKKAFCHQQLGDLEAAYMQYTNASLMKTPGPWLLKKLAFLSKTLGKIDEAIAYYTALLDMEPENVKIMMSLANLLVRIKRYSEALQHYYHANYLQPESAPILRSIAWAELMNGNTIKSIDYLSRVISQNATPSDYLNIGHAYFISNQRKEALNYYRLSFENSSDNFKNTYLEDTTDLVELGLSRNDMLLMLEAIMN